MTSDRTPGGFLFRILSVLLMNDFPSSDILQGNFKPDFYLKYIQKDLRLAIALGDAVNHPTPMAAAANEVTAGSLGASPSSPPLFPLHSSLCLLWLGLALCLTSQGGILGG